MSAGNGFKVGDFTIHKIVEEERPFYDIKTYFPTLTDEVLAEHRDWLQACGAIDAQGQIVLCMQCYVVRTPQHTILVDSCIGNDKNLPHRPQWNRMNRPNFHNALAAAGVSVEEIDYVMCTHLHLDHVGWNTKLENGRWVPTFPNARYIFSKKEYAYWAEETRNGAVTPMNDSVIPIVEAKRADLVASDFQVNDHIRFLPTPGHTPDHYVIQLGRTGQDAVMTGDLMHSPLQAKIPELGMRVDFDSAMGGRSRRSFLQQYCDTDTLICPCHFPSPSVGRISAWGDGFRFNFDQKQES